MLQSVCWFCTKTQRCENKSLRFLLAYCDIFVHQLSARLWIFSPLSNCFSNNFLLLTAPTSTVGCVCAFVMYRTYIPGSCSLILNHKVNVPKKAALLCWVDTYLSWAPTQTISRQRINREVFLYSAGRDQAALVWKQLFHVWPTPSFHRYTVGLILPKCTPSDVKRRGVGGA